MQRYKRFFNQQNVLSKTTLFFRITIKKVLDNYAVKSGRAKRKAPAGKSAGAKV
jgi:hypothetical protein